MKFYRSAAGILALSVFAATGTVAAGNHDSDSEKGPKRSVEDVTVLDSSSFTISFDKTFPAGLDLERVVDVKAVDEDGNTIDIGDTSILITKGDRSEITVKHDDLDGQSGSLIVGEEEIEFDYDEEAGTFTLNIFHTNDNHGRTDAFPHLVTAYNEAKDEYGDGLLLDAGDIFSGTLYFNEYRGQDAIEFMNLMEYDAFVPGNHEFDLGDPDEGHPELVEFFEAADFPIVAANIDFSGDSGFDHLNQGGISSDPEAGNIYDGIVLEQDGEEIGIFGLDTADTENISSPLDVEFTDYLEAAEEAVAGFEEQGIDKVIALTHLGYNSSPDIGSDLILAEEVEGIDVIIGGHSHTLLETPVLVDENAEGEEKDPTIIGQAGEYGGHLGVMDITFDENGTIVDFDGEVKATEDYEADPEAAEMLEPYTEGVEELANEPAGSTVVNELPNPRHGDGDEESVRANETALGNLITDAQLDAALTADEDTIMAVQNGGGIRTSIAAGEVTVGELIEVQPFGNRLALLDLTGEEIYEAFEHSVSEAPEENGGFLQVSEGTELTYDSSRSADERVESISVDGEELSRDDEMHTVAMNNFTATGGDGFDVFAEAYDDGRGTIVGYTDWEMLRDFMAELGEVDYSIQGRITDLASDDE
jgi:5'-nucleotidase / UDP-sugar diphosphatase